MPSALDSLPVACSVLDMPTSPTTSRGCFLCDRSDVTVEAYIDPHYKKGKQPAYRCVDRKDCAAFIRETDRAYLVELVENVEIATENLALAREDVKHAEDRLADSIREAVKEGASVTKIARAARLSRERIYQIRDGRR